MTMSFYNFVVLLSAILLLDISQPVYAQPSAGSADTSVVSAQALSTPTIASVASVPSCADSCLQQAINTANSCKAEDRTCLCQHATSIQSALSSCLKSSQCSQSDRSAMSGYFLQLCGVTDQEQEENQGQSQPSIGFVGSISTATGSPSLGTTPAPSSLGLSSSAGHNMAQQTSSATNTDDSNDNKDSSTSQNISTPAIVGVTLAVAVVTLVVVGLMVWAYIRRRNLRRRTRMMMMGNLEMDDKSLPAAPRPTRPTTNAEFLVQPSPVEKDDNTEKEDVGTALSRQSTLVVPPTVLDKPLPNTRFSAIEGGDHRPVPRNRDSARQRAVEIFRGRSSWLSVGKANRSPARASQLPSSSPLRKAEGFDENNYV